MAIEARPIKRQAFKNLPVFQKGKLSKEEIDGKTVIKNVVIVQEGIDKVGDYFSKEFLDELVADVEERPIGIKARFGHPNLCKTTLGTYIGRYKNFRVEKDEDRYKVIADLHLADITKKTDVEGQNITYHDYIIELAKEDHDAFGNSIVFTCEEETKEVDIKGERTLVNYLIYKNLIASDLVDSPAATDNLFKNVDDLGITVSTFLDENPEIFKAIDKNPEILTRFFAQYISKSKNSKMTLFKKMKNLFGIQEQKNISVTTVTGDILEVVTDNETPSVGDSVNLDGSPAPDGEHELTDGSIITTSGGKITEIKEPEEESQTETEVEEEQEEGKGDSETAQALKSVQETLKSVQETLKGLEKRILKSEENIVDVTKAVNFIGKQVTSNEAFKVDKGSQKNDEEEQEQPTKRTIKNTRGDQK